MKRKDFKEKMEVVEMLMDGWRSYSVDFINSPEMVSRLNAIADCLFYIREDISGGKS